MSFPQNLSQSPQLSLFFGSGGRKLRPILALVADLVMCTWCKCNLNRRHYGERTPLSSSPLFQNPTFHTTWNHCSVTIVNQGRLNSCTVVQLESLRLLTTHFATIIFASPMPFDGTSLAMQALLNIVICQTLCANQHQCKRSVK